MTLFTAPPSYHKLYILPNLNEDLILPTRTQNFVWIFQFYLLFLTNELKKSGTLFYYINKKLIFIHQQIVLIVSWGTQILLAFQDIFSLRSYLDIGKQMF